ncbi:MAG: hypothetical protein WD468_12990 [Pirellulales bacterium]
MVAIVTRINPWPIVRDQFRPYRVDEGTREINIVHLLVFLVLPMIGGGSLAWALGALAGTYVPTFIAVFAIVAAVFTGLVPIIYAVARNMQLPDRQDEGAWKAVRDAKVRVEVLRELYANIAFAVLLLIFSLVPLVILLFALPEVVADVLSGIVYGVGIAICFSFLHIITGVYEVLDDQASDLMNRLR